VFSQYSSVLIAGIDSRVRRVRTQEVAASRCFQHGSTTQAKPLNQLAVAPDVAVAQVVEEPAALADQQEQPAAAVVIVLVLLEVLSQI